MRNTFIVLFIALIAFGLTSCIKSTNQPAPPLPTKSDTSKTLIGSTLLVGNWNIVADTITTNGQTFPYQGTPADHYNFTKYGNLFIHSEFHSYIDTAIYGIAGDSKSVQWINSFISVDGESSRQPSTSGVFIIRKITDHSLVLSQDITAVNGDRHERIWFQK